MFPCLMRVGIAVPLPVLGMEVAQLWGLDASSSTAHMFSVVRLASGSAVAMWAEQRTLHPKEQGLGLLDCFYEEPLPGAWPDDAISNGFRS